MKYSKVLVVCNEATEVYCRKAMYIELPYNYGISNGELMWRNENDDSAIYSPHRLKLDQVHHFECEDADMVSRMKESGLNVYDHFLDKSDPDYYDQTDNVIDRRGV